MSERKKRPYFGRAQDAEMSGYTSGPWVYDGGAQIFEVARPHMRICFLPSDYRKYANSEPNAHLIAAAPELLEALKHCIIERSEWLEEARAAVAKAENRS